VTIPGSILVPVDGSKFAEHALPYGLGLARRTGASLHLALVHIPLESLSPAYPLADVVEARVLEQRDHETAYLESLVRRLESAGVEIHPALLQGHVAAALSRLVTEREIGLVVMTTHGRGGLQRAWLGSTSDGMIRSCCTPVLLVRPEEEAEAGERPFRRVVAALDGSVSAERALRSACGPGLTDGASVVLTHVMQPPVVAASPYLPHTLQLSPEEVAAREAQLGAYLEEVGRQDWLAGRTVETRVVVDYEAAPAILEVAAEVDADLIVVGTHGRSGLRRMILGSVADKVVRGTHRPVLVCRGMGSSTRSANMDTRSETSEPTEVPALP
jgi:nucleotide-binding universal stress UspA family protein